MTIDWAARAAAHGRTVRQEVDAVKAAEQLEEMAHYLPAPYQGVMRTLVEDISAGQHDQAITAMLRPATIRKARELACRRPS